MQKLFLASLLTLGVASMDAQHNIYPTPHHVATTENKIDISKGFKLIGADKADPIAVDLLSGLISTTGKTKLFIGEKGDKSVSKFKTNLPDVSGAYYLKVTPKEIVVIGSDERGTYYAVRTLQQLIQGNSIPEVEITDYPDIRFRGTVEGFYGTPWSHRDRLAQLKFYGENKLNTYIYGPKDDPYHSAPNWRKPYPEQEARQISELARVAKENHVDFVWAIHPGGDIKWNEEDYQLLLQKFNLMYDLGVRSFAVFFDDIAGEGTNPNKQAALLNRLNQEFVKVKEGVTPLIMCPTEYNKSWSNPSPQGYLSILGRELDKSVEIMWTGDHVCDDITPETLAWINERIQRPTYIWWNFPVSDYVRHRLLQGPSYGLTKEGKGKMNGFVSNPMEHAESSKVALFGVADYTWNVAEYDHMKAWEEGLKRVMPEASADYRTFAIHSADLEQNGHNYRRDESWEIAPAVAAYLNGDHSKGDVIYAEFKKMNEAPARILASGADPYLLEEMKPWLTEFEKLGKRGMDVFTLIELYNKGDQEGFWNAYANGLMSPEERTAYNKHKSGTLVMNPFIEKHRSQMEASFYEMLAGEKLPVVTPITSFAKKETLPAMMDKDDKTFFYSWATQKVGSWIGVDLGRNEEVSNIEILQGRKEGDRDIFQRAILEYSTDNSNWTALTDTLKDAYRIQYNLKPVQARYVRLRATEGSGTRNWTAFRSFHVNPQQREATLTTNIPQLASLGVETEGNVIRMKKILEVIAIEKGGYLGIELPMITDIKRVSFELSNGKPAVEYSLDGENWKSGKPTKARFVRFANKSGKEISANLRKFEVETIAQNKGDLMNAFDRDFYTGFEVENGRFELNRVPATTGVSLLFTNGAFRVEDQKGNLLAESTNGLISLPLDQATDKLIISGNGTLREIIWKK
ncbi:MAG: beta-N-acetylglucosaminidase domain-containing protein [Bacteroidales bacterium]